MRFIGNLCIAIERFTGLMIKPLIVFLLIEINYILYSGIEVVGGCY